MLGKKYLVHQKFYLINILIDLTRILKTFLEKTKINQININNILKKTSDLKILLLGEIIFDKYTYLNINGVSSKSSALSTTITKSKNMAGGILLALIF